MCPQCCNSENMLITQLGDEFKCLVCGYQFKKNGEQIEVDEENEEEG